MTLKEYWIYANFSGFIYSRSIRARNILKSIQM